MRQSALVLSLVALCIFVSFTSAGVLDSISSKRKKTKVTAGSKEVRTNSSSVIVPTADGGQMRIDMCEGNIVVPLSSSRNVKRNFTVKSTLFPFKRSTPLICSWNVKVSKNCRLGLVTMTINERSRLSGDEGCLNGYYSVSPFMEDVKICGRINSVPPFQWYVEDQEPEVTINLKHVGLGDGYSEGLAFTLSGECLAETSNMTKTKAKRSYSNWLYKLAGQSLNYGVPTLILPDDDDAYTTTISPFWSETDDTNQVVPDNSTTKDPTKVVLDFDLETPWHVLKNHSVPSRTSTTTATTTKNSTKPQTIPHSVLSSNNSVEVEPHPIINLNYTNLNQTAILSTTISPITAKHPVNNKPILSGSNFNLETPWHILKNQSLMAASSSQLKNDSSSNANVSLNGTSAAVQTVEVIMWT